MWLFAYLLHTEILTETMLNTNSNMFAN